MDVHYFTYKGVRFSLLKDSAGAVSGVRMCGKNTIFWRDTTEDKAVEEAKRMIDAEVTE